MVLRLDDLTIKHRRFLLMMHNPDGPNPEAAAVQFAAAFGEVVRPETVRSYWIREGRPVNAINSQRRSGKEYGYNMAREEAMVYLAHF